MAIARSLLVILLSAVSSCALPRGEFGFPELDPGSLFAGGDKEQPTFAFRFAVPGSIPWIKPDPKEEVPKLPPKVEIVPPPKEELPPPMEELPQPKEQLPPPKEELPPPMEQLPPPKEELPPPVVEIPVPNYVLPPMPKGLFPAVTPPKEELPSPKEEYSVKQLPPSKK